MFPTSILIPLLAATIAQTTGPAQGRPSYSPDVKTAQNCLNALGYEIDNDGLWNDATSTALRKFQSSNKLKPTGQLDEPTRTALRSAVIKKCELAPASAVKGIPDAYRYEGNDVVILGRKSGSALWVLYISGQWRIMKNDFPSLPIQEEVYYISTIPPGTPL